MGVKIRIYPGSEITLMKIGKLKGLAKTRLQRQEKMEEIPGDGNVMGSCGRVPLHAGVILLVCFFALLLWYPAGAAIEGEETVIALALEPGSSYSVPIPIFLAPGEPEGPYRIAVADLGQSAFDGSFIALLPGEVPGPHSARPFLVLEEDQVVLRQGNNVINVTIKLPPDPGDGGRYAIIQVRRTTDIPTGPQPVPIAEIPLFITIEGSNIITTDEITAMEVTIIGREDSTRVLTYFRNTGNFHLSGIMNRVIVKDRDGKVITQGETGTIAQPIIPDQEIMFNVSIGKSFSNEEFVLVSRIELPDGTTLAEKEESMGSGGVEDATDTPKNAHGSRQSPGFSPISILIAFGIVVPVHQIFAKLLQKKNER